jgi:hypothetical protein
MLQMIDQSEHALYRRYFIMTCTVPLQAHHPLEIYFVLGRIGFKTILYLWFTRYLKHHVHQHYYHWSTPSPSLSLSSAAYHDHCHQHHDIHQRYIVCVLQKSKWKKVRSSLEYTLQTSRISLYGFFNRCLIPFKVRHSIRQTDTQ